MSGIERPRARLTARPSSIYLAAVDHPLCQLDRFFGQDRVLCIDERMLRPSRNLSFLPVEAADPRAPATRFGLERLAAITPVSKHGVDMAGSVGRRKGSQYCGVRVPKVPAFGL